MANDFVLQANDGTAIILESSPDQIFVISGGEQGPQGIQGPEAGVTTQGSTNQITQTGHALFFGEILRMNTGYYSLAQANGPASADVIGMVFAVKDLNTFVMITEGYVSGFSGLTPGAVYFLDPVTPGGMTLTEPTTTGQVRKPMFVADSPTSGYFHNYEGIIVNGTGGGGGGGAATPLSVVVHAGDYTITNSDDILVETTAGANVTMQTPASATVKLYRINNSASDLITINAATVNGASTYVLYPGLTVNLLPVGSNFIII